MDSPWEGHEKFSQEQDVGFQLNCQRPENLGGSVEYSPWRTRRGENTVLKLAEEKLLCFAICFLPINKNSFPLSFTLSKPSTDAALKWCTWKWELFSSFLPTPPTIDKKGWLQALSRVRETQSWLWDREDKRQEKLNRERVFFKGQKTWIIYISVLALAT